SSQRRFYAMSENKKYRENMEDYVKSYYFAKSLARMDATDPHDLSKPFRLTLEIVDSGSGIVKNGEGAVAMHAAALFNGFPIVLRDWKEPSPDDNPKDLPKKRAHDFVFPVPKVKQFVYRIVPPAGYAARTLPQNQTRKLGTVSYSTEFSTEPDGAVVAKL